MPRKTIIAALFFALLASACAPTMATRGNFVDDERLQSIQLNVSTKDEVMAKIGTPTTIDPFDPDRWFYIGEKTATTSFFDPKIQSRKVLAMQFSKDGLLQSVDNVDEKAAKDIEMVKKKTPAPGREMSTLEQFFSNMGKFNQSANQQQSPGRE